MVKNEKGVTLMILVVTIIVIIILAGVVMSINMNLNKSVELKEVLANMEMIRTAAAPYRDKYKGDTVEEEVTDKDNVKSTIYHISNKFVGEHLEPKNSEMMNLLLNYAGLDTITEDAHYWFKLDKEALEKLNINLETSKTENNVEAEEDLYFINYSNLEVGYCKNKKDDRGYYIGIKARKRFGNSNDPIKERYVYFYNTLKDVKTREVRK